jgi:tetratricopeptide (TPR) repeat protein
MASVSNNRRNPLFGLVTRRGLLIAAAVAVFSLMFVAVLISLILRGERDPSPSPDQTRAIALFETQNYLSALEALRALPTDETRPHAYLGAAYLNLHLYQAARVEFEEASRRSPASVDPWIGLAIVYLKLGDGQTALKHAGEAVEVAGDSSDAWIVLARAHWFQRDSGKAEEAALRVHEIDPSNQPATELLLRIYFEQNDAAKFQDLLDRTPDPNKAVQDLAVQFAVRQGRFSQAYDLRKRHSRRAAEARILRAQLALNRNEAATELIPGLVRDLVLVGRAEEALAAGARYSGPISLDLEFGKAEFLLGNRQRSLQHYARASAEGTHKLSAEVALAALTGDSSHWLEAFRAERLEHDYFVLAQLQGLLTSATPLVKGFIYRYAGLFDVSFFNASAQYALSHLDLEPDQFEALMTLGNAYQRLGRTDDAKRYVERARDLYPRRAEPWSRLGQIALAANNPQSALENFQTAVLLEPSHASHLYNLAWLLDQLDRDAEAVPLYGRAIQASKLSFEALNNLALIESEAGRSDRAIRLLDQAVAANTENEAAYLNRGNYYAGQRQWRDALKDYETVLTLNPAMAFAAVEQGRIHLELGNVDRALAMLNQALATDPTLHEAYILMSTAYKRMNRTHEADAALAEARRIQPDSSPQPADGL